MAPPAWRRGSPAPLRPATNREGTTDVGGANPAWTPVSDIEPFAVRFVVVPAQARACRPGAHEDAVRLVSKSASGERGRPSVQHRRPLATCLHRVGQAAGLSPLATMPGRRWLDQGRDAGRPRAV